MAVAVATAAALLGGGDGPMSARAAELKVIGSSGVRSVVNQLGPQAWPSLPTMMWSGTEMPSGFATSTITRVISMSARDGVGSPPG